MYIFKAETAFVYALSLDTSVNHYAFIKKTGIGLFETAFLHAMLLVRMGLAHDQ